MIQLSLRHQVEGMVARSIVGEGLMTMKRTRNQVMNCKYMVDAPKKYVRAIMRKKMVVMAAEVYLVLGLVLARIHRSPLAVVVSRGRMTLVQE